MRTKIEFVSTITNMTSTTVLPNVLLSEILKYLRPELLYLCNLVHPHPLLETKCTQEEVVEYLISGNRLHWLVLIHPNLDMVMQYAIAYHNTKAGEWAVENGACNFKWSLMVACSNIRIEFPRWENGKFQFDADAADVREDDPDAFDEKISQVLPPVPNKGFIRSATSKLATRKR